MLQTELESKTSGSSCFLVDRKCARLTARAARASSSFLSLFLKTSASPPSSFVRGVM